MKQYENEQDFERDVRYTLKCRSCALLPKIEDPSQRGIADVLFTYKGRMHAFELKLKPFKMSDIKTDKRLQRQVNWLYEKHMFMWVTGIVSPKDVREYMQVIFDENYLPSRDFQKNFWLQQYSDYYNLKKGELDAIKRLH